MLDINLIRTQPDLVRQALINRGDKPESLDAVLQLDMQRRDILKKSEQLRSLRNNVSKEIGRMAEAAGREAKKAEMRQVGDQISALENELAQVEANLVSYTSVFWKSIQGRT